MALFWIITANYSPHQPPIVNDDVKNKRDSSSLSKDNEGTDPQDYYLRGEASLNDTAYAEGKQLSVKNERYMCDTPFVSSTYYVEEYYIPLTCSQPVGITVDSSNRIWFVATWSGYLVVFDSDLRRFVIGRQKVPSVQWYGGWNLICKATCGLQIRLTMQFGDTL